jgi:hypothetical protein
MRGDTSQRLSSNVSLEIPSITLSGELAILNTASIGGGVSDDDFSTMMTPASASHRFA